MELIILGKTNDDKGTQLEKLTASILSKQGYVDIYTNVVNAGASEVDIKAAYKHKFMNGELVRDVIGECKAYKNPVSLPDWLKFLGKIFSAELAGTQVQGCFVALSGVNGNVIGHYEMVKSKRPEIVLLTGESLSTLLQHHFDLKSIEEIQAITQSLTNRQPINFAIFYYEGKFYWQISFAESKYTVLTGNGAILQQIEADELHEMIINGSALLNYVDLLAEKTSSERHERLNQYITSALLVENRFLDTNEILSKVVEFFADGITHLKLTEVQASLNSLEQFRIVQNANDKFNLMLFSNAATVQDVLSFYGYFTYNNVVLKGLLSPNYGTKINEEVLDHIIKKQGDVKLTAEKYAECLQLIKWSPSALAWGLIPDPNITNHRSKGEALAPKLEDHDSEYFIRKMYSLFSQEFSNQFMSEYFFKLGLRELDVRSTVKITRESGVEISNLSKERIGLAKLTDEFNNQIIPITMLDDKSVLSDVDPTKTSPLN